MKPEEIRDAIWQLPEDQRRELIVELMPKFMKQVRDDAVLRDEWLSLLRAKTVSQGQIILSSATEKVESARRAIKEKLFANQ